MRFSQIHKFDILLSYFLKLYYRKTVLYVHSLKRFISLSLVSRCHATDKSAITDLVSNFRQIQFE